MNRRTFIKSLLILPFAFNIKSAYGPSVLEEPLKDYLILDTVLSEYEIEQARKRFIEEMTNSVLYCGVDYGKGDYIVSSIWIIDENDFSKCVANLEQSFGEDNYPVLGSLNYIPERKQ